MLTSIRAARRLRERGTGQRRGLSLLAGIVALMWVVEVINTIDTNHLDSDGIYARNVDRFWGILTSPFIHASFQHLTRQHRAVRVPRRDHRAARRPGWRW